MNSKEVQLIKSNTNVLAKALDYKLVPAEKLEVIRQLYDNLSFLKKDLPKDEYENDYSVIETRVNAIVEKITSPEAVTDFISKIKAILETSKKFTKQVNN